MAVKPAATVCASWAMTPRFCLQDVVSALIGAGVVDKEPTSKRDLLAMQEAFNTWREQSGRSARELSRLLALSVG